MKYLGPTSRRRLNEAVAFVFLFAGVFLALGLATYHSFDPSLNTVTWAEKAQNMTGPLGAMLADMLLQGLGLAAYTIPVFVWILAWKWFRGSSIQTPAARLLGAMALILSTCTAFGLSPDWYPIGGVISAGGLAGALLSSWLVSGVNVAGAALITAACWILSVYLVSSFELAWLKTVFSTPLAYLNEVRAKLAGWSEARAEKRLEKVEARAAAKQAKAMAALKKAEHKAAVLAAKQAAPAKARAAAAAAAGYAPAPVVEPEPPIVDPLAGTAAPHYDVPFDVEEIPIRPLEQIQEAASLRSETARLEREPRRQRSDFEKPSTELLNEASARSPYDSQELKETAVRIKAKFEEFNVLGSVVQINPGPVVTTFEFKPEAGVKISRITTLSEDLCMGLQAESILIERIPGKPTVGIEVPNSKREVISLRQILESEEFEKSTSPLTVALGKDISGRIQVAALDSMPHLLIAGSTGSGKSVMLNSLIMSILYKSTPDQVRMIMVDPKRLEFGLYEGIPHLLTPVITDAKKATNALRNAVLEMERRLKLLASLGVRSIDQYNRKVRQMQAEPLSLFEEESGAERPEPIPYILIVIDELADLMMLERAAVEETVTRLAQMARAVGMHLVLATQRPSVDVITGLIKANFPSRISFRVATKVDSRTVLDGMGAEQLLGKGDMLFLPPGTSRVVRVHGSYVSEAETNRVVEFWKAQAEPEYDKSLLLAPPEPDEDPDSEQFDGDEDPMYQDAVRVVLEQGKASTSTLQRRLRLGYGRAARILDMMQREGIIGPPDGSRPRDVLKRPDWLSEVENQLR